VDTWPLIIDEQFAGQITNTDQDAIAVRSVIGSRRDFDVRDLAYSLDENNEGVTAEYIYGRAA
jgi:hypothetical protein